MTIKGRSLPKSIILLCAVYDCLMMAKWCGRNAVYCNYNEYMIFFYYLLCYLDFILNNYAKIKYKKYIIQS